MKAAVFYAPGDVRMQDVPIPQISSDEALLKVIKVGICGGDVHFYDGSHPYSNYPQIYGHEVVGIIERMGSESAQFKAGDIVVAEILIACGECYPCCHGKPNCCVNLKVIGAHTQGAFAEYAVYPIKNLHKVPDGMPLDDAVLVEPYTIGYRCVERSEIADDETALVIGVGAIGLTVVDILKAKGVRVIAADLSDFRRTKALAMGADAIIDPGRENLVERVRELTNGEGAGVVFEATGVSQVMSMTEDLVAAGGTIVIVGLTNDKVPFTGLNFTKCEMTVKGSRNSVCAFQPVLKLMREGRLHQKELLTKSFKFDDAPEAFAYTAKNIQTEGKVVLEL